MVQGQIGTVAPRGHDRGSIGRTLPHFNGDKPAWKIGTLQATSIAIGSMGKINRGSLEPTDHGLDLNTDVLGKFLRAEV